MMQLIKTLKALRQCKRGNALIIVAATAPLLVAASAIGLDSIQVTLAKRQLQRSADSAALAGVHALLQDEDAVTAAVDRDLAHNNNMTLTSPRIIQNSPATGTYATDPRAVRVALTATRSVPFISFFTGDDMDISVEATATAVPDGVYCVISLEEGNNIGIEFGGGSEYDFGCGLATNSTHATAVWTHGSPTVTATPIAARGGVPAATEFEGDTMVIPNAPRQPDPFEYLADPEIPAGMECVDLGTVRGPASLAGDSCYSGLELKSGNITLGAGTYYINGGEFSIGSGANITGEGVTIVLTSENAVSNPGSIATLNTSGQATLNLTAPTAGPFANVLFYMDPRAPDRTMTINGGADSTMDGAVYMPSQSITFNGGAGLDLLCMRIVTLRVTFTGSANLVNNCDADDPNRGFRGWMVRLVG